MLIPADGTSVIELNVDNVETDRYGDIINIYDGKVNHVL